MSKQNSRRNNVYECVVSNEEVIVRTHKDRRPKRIGWAGSYENIDEDILKDLIVPKLNELRNAGRHFEYPVAVISWHLSPGKSSKPLPLSTPRGKLFVKQAGGLRNLKRMVGIPIGRAKNFETQILEAIIYENGAVDIVPGNKSVLIDESSNTFRISKRDLIHVR